jgi:hypothetical protein
MKQLVRLRNSSMSVVLLACLMAVSTPPSAAQEVQYNPMTIPEADHVTSPPLRDLPPDLLWRPSSPRTLHFWVGDQGRPSLSLQDPILSPRSPPARS